MTNNTVHTVGFRRFTLLLATAFLLSLVSCLSGDIPVDPAPPYPPTPTPPSGDSKVVALRIDQPTMSDTRGVSRPVVDGEQVQFNEGHLFLTTLEGLIVRHFTITPHGTHSHLITEHDIVMRGSISINDLENGKSLVVPGSISHVYVVGNTQLPATAGNINNIVRGGERGLGLVHGTVTGVRRDNIASQWNVWYPIGVNMFASAPLERKSDNVWRPYHDLTLAPTVARFEINRLTGMGLIESFAVSGIFIDRYIPQAHIDGSFFPANVTPTALYSNPANFRRGVGNYITAHQGLHGGGNPIFKGALFTEYAPVPFPSEPRTANGVIASPPGTLVWHYQVFARHYRNDPTAPNVGAGSTPPRIVIRLENVRLQDGIELPGYQWLTVGDFRRTGENTTLLQTGIRASNVYRILDLRFDEKDLQHEPNMGFITAVVDVQLAQWRPGEDWHPSGFRQPYPRSRVLDCDAFYTFHLDVAVCGYCAPYAPPSIRYLWQESDDGVTWRPAVPRDETFNNTSASFSTPRLRANRHYRRQATCNHCERTITTQAAVLSTYCLVPYFVETGHQAIIVWETGLRPMNVEATFGEWTVAFAGGVQPGWLGQLPEGPQPPGTFSVNVTQLNNNPATRSAELVFRSGALEERAIIVQIGTDIFGTAMRDAYVGAFWRHYQRGERLIQIANANNNGWTAITSAYWIQLDRLPSADPNIFTNNPASLSGLANDMAHRLCEYVGMEGGIVSAESGPINFRIGLRSALPSADSPPRYGMVVLQHNNRTETHIIWVRQGERADYIMRPTDIRYGDDNQPRGTAAVRWSPFNLTADNLNAAVGTRANQIAWGGVAGAGRNRSLFVQYPSQGGAFWQWASALSPRMAWSQLGTVPNPNNVWTQSASPATSGWWNALAANHEVCPPGWRRPTDGPTNATAPNATRPNIRTSEARQSLFSRPPLGTQATGANAVYGFYADGFFDRRPRATPPNNGVANSAVAVGTNNIAFRGALVFNLQTQASLFFPASGRRSASAPAQAPQAAGNLAHFVTAGSVQGTVTTGANLNWANSGWLFELSSTGVRPWSCVRACAHSMRCVAE